jgi:hypothetical protein
MKIPGDGVTIPEAEVQRAIEETDTSELNQNTAV